MRLTAHAGFGGRPPGKGPGSPNMNTGPRRAAHPTLIHALTCGATDHPAHFGTYSEQGTLEDSLKMSGVPSPDALREQGDAAPSVAARDDALALLSLPEPTSISTYHQNSLLALSSARLFPPEVSR